MGDAFAYRQVTYTAATCKIVFEVRDGVPGCVRIELVADAESFIRAKDLTSLRLDDLRLDAYALTGVTQTEDGRFVHRMNYRQDRKRLERTKTRRKVTPDLLRKVASVHNETPEGGRIEAIKAAFSVSDRQALRYTALARQEGLISDGRT
jgi:hypothetical protein